MDDDALRIFATGSPRGQGPRREQPQTLIAESPPVSRRSAGGSALEAELERILDGLPNPGESVQSSFDRKEGEVCGLFASLGPNERKVVLVRLAEGGRGDRIVAVIARLAGERRRRVMAVLARSTRCPAGAR